tara:strand:+ start:628 stop:936 length:309 start_codon:yes stop_codon:yes gene_type:complete
MPEVTFQGASVTTGHGCDGVTTIFAGSSDVLVDNGSKGVAREDDALSAHTFPSGTQCVSHGGQKVNQGSQTVFVNDKPIARKGDPCDIAGEVTEAFNGVIAG